MGYTVIPVRAVLIAMSYEHKNDISDLDDNSLSVGVLDEPIRTTINVVSKDGETFNLSLKSARLSELIMVATNGDEDAKEVPIPSVNSVILKLIVTYLNHHEDKAPAEIEIPLRSKNMKDVCEDHWDADFIDGISMDRKKLYDLILAANYMCIKSLMHLGCAKVASLIKGQPLEKIEEILNPNTVQAVGGSDDQKMEQ